MPWYIKSMYGKRTHLIFLSGSMLMVAAFGNVCLSHGSERSERKRLLNVILFETYMAPPVSEEAALDKSVWPALPKIFSRAIALSNLQDIQAPSDIQFPTNPMFLDIDTFSITGTGINQKSSFSRRNEITGIGYKLTAVLGSDNQYVVILEGHHEDLKFRDISVEVPSEKTVLIRIRHSANRTLYIAFTFISLKDEVEHGNVYPKPLSNPRPRYPSELFESKWTGKIRILCTVSATGRVDPRDFVLLECPHTLFARISTNTVLNEWTFKPATSSGIPISLQMTVEVPFLNPNSIHLGPLIPAMPVPKSITQP